MKPGKLKTACIFVAYVTVWLLTTSSAFAFNDDGAADLLWRYYGSGGYDAAWFLDNTGTYVSNGSIDAVTDTGWKMVGTGDFNNDGQIDILWRYTNGANVVWFMSGTTLVSSASLESVTDTNWVVAGTGYFNPAPDYSVDILWRNLSTGSNVVWCMSGTTHASSINIAGLTDMNWEVGATADFNNDGICDIVWRNKSDGSNAIWYFDGSTINSTAFITSNSDTTWRVVGANYFDTNSTPDLLWRNISSGDNAIWYFSGTNYLSASLLPSITDVNWKIGGTGDSKIDIDQDGLPDLWERNNFGSTTAQNGSGDPDGDGLTNQQEAQSGTLPLTPEIRVRIGRPRTNGPLP